MKHLRLIPHNTSINFVGLRYVTFTLCAFVAITSLYFAFFKGLNFGIDFKGGYVVEVRFKEVTEPAHLRTLFKDIDVGEITLQQIGGAKDFIIKIESKENSHSPSQANEVVAIVKKVLPQDTDYRRIETVGPKVGEEMVRNALKAIAFSLIAMLVYIAFRFEWQFAVCAVIALAHDCLAILSLFCVFPLEFNETAIIAILITAGYSINDTIVIFDRIREGMIKHQNMSIRDLINHSLNSTLSRTTLTAVTTLLAVLSLYFFGGPVIAKFSLPILVGILVGTFSSIFLAAPLLMYLKIEPPVVKSLKKGAPANR